jgi:hypothetical protein
MMTLTFNKPVQEHDSLSEWTYTANGFGLVTRTESMSLFVVNREPTVASCGGSGMDE